MPSSNNTMKIINLLSDLVWGPVSLTLLVGTGIFLTIGLRFQTMRKIGRAFEFLFSGTARPKEGDDEAGEITPFQALMTALSATVGTGNIAGVATAIFLGGPGAIFWMWLTALFGMATKFAEAVLAVHYRNRLPDSTTVGGPMYYIENGLGPKWKWLGVLFAIFASVAAFGLGNTVQSNSVSRAIESTTGIPYWVTGLVLAILTGLVIIGGIKRIARITEMVVPIMAVIYVMGGVAILLVNAGKILPAFQLIFSDAFTGTAAVGGFAGSTLTAAIRFGVARGVFSNEAGLGSAPIAHAAARTSNPVRQGLIAMLGTFIDTICICSITALVILVTGAWESGLTGAELSTKAFGDGIPGFGDFIVAFGLIFFAFSTLLAWSYYGEVCMSYLFGHKSKRLYRWAWIIAVFGGAIINLDLVWAVADVMNGLMMIPNLIALLVLSPVVFRMAKKFFDTGH